MQCLQLLLHLSHLLLEFLLLFFLDVVLSKNIKVNLWYFFVLAVELIQLLDWVGVGLGACRVVPELFGLPMYLVGALLALFAVAKVKALSTMDLCLV